MANKHPDADPEAIARITEWHDLGVNPGGIASALNAEGLPVPPGTRGPWSASTVKATLERLGVKADTLRAAEAVFTPEDEAEGWAGHSGDKFTRPWLDRDGRNVRDTGCPGEQGAEGMGADTSFADRALEHLERREKDDQ